jgi:type I restriction enzyme M protein
MKVAEDSGLPQIAPPLSEPKSGFLEDFISGELVRASPEEIDAVQVIARRLVEDYGYTKRQIQTHPQFRVRRRPSDEEKSYPVDIAVFRDERKTEDDLLMLVECKQQNRKEGLGQLRLYMDMSPAEVGVWFNGEDHVYLRKVHHKDGRRTYEEIPNIPRRGQRIEDIGLYRRQDLTRPSNLKAVFRDLRNHLAGNTTGITRDEVLAQEIINILFCKIYDEINTGPDEVVTFRSGVGEPSGEVKRRIVELFDRRVRTEYSDVFSNRDTIGLDGDSVAYVVGELQTYCLVEADRDAIGEAFEVFIGPALRGGEGQFFTPRNVVRMVIDILDPEPGDMILDPACGSGGFLIMALEHVWKKLEAQALKKGWTPVQLDRKKRDAASRCFRGIDKDSFLAKVTKAYMAIVGDGRGGIFCENSLLPPADWHPSTQSAVPLARFDVVITNPPFGTKIPIRGQNVLTQYDLGHRWKKDKSAGTVERSDIAHDQQPPQILFLERCLQFLKPGGRLGIVLPESILGNPSYEYVIRFLRTFRILGIVTLPEALFKTSGKGGTHCKVCVLFVQKETPRTRYDIFMADVKWCGHDSRGNPTLRKGKDGRYVLLDEVPHVAPRFRLLTTAPTRGDHRGFSLSSDDIRGQILVPKYYSPEVEASLLSLKTSHNLITLGSLVQDGRISLATGIEIGKMAYGTGRIPFIRTSDLSNWEIKADFKHGVSNDIYEELRGRVDVLPGDILMVRDGTYLVGTTAIVTESDVPMLFQSHIFRIRVEDRGVVDAWLLLICLNAPVVKMQIRAKQFTQDIIDTLGQRILDLVLPIPKDRGVRARLARQAKEIMEQRVRLREQARRLPMMLEDARGMVYDNEA